MDRPDFISLFCLLCLFTGLQSSSVQLTEASCDYSTFKRVDNFNISKFLGVWHEIKYVLSFTEEPGTEWTDFELHFKEDGGHITDNIIARNGSGICIYHQDKIQPKSFGWTQPIEGQSVDRDWIVFDTDYTSYAFLYGCWTGNTTTCVDGRIWIISRTQKMSQERLDQAQAMAEAVCMTPLKTTKFVKSCPAGKFGIISVGYQRGHEAEKLPLPYNCEYNAHPFLPPGNVMS
ncbi:hypothetical protein LOTGIDRAFT_168831 [Lottia gigantea]|uniref:Lipocalin/cytosolic fatty-acid binding domain-containing protein n=1 Tax=Lottia gigantea TaxID=225164 RepID=V3ZJH6_LOTGI|nr:hypothetical protein LOTGIDRAFT_168831 [Lottia gigantea]ESO84382.1 hypothetical protein LOTGIDRAFT_168831 [Lottia gigantea]